MRSSSFSFLEHAPYDVLQHIAYLGAEPGFAPPGDLRRLLTTSRALYNGLNIHANPHLYAAIYKLKYASRISHCLLSTDSLLAAELVQRCRALRRCFHLDMSTDGLHQDLWTLLWLVVEEGQCAPLIEAGFPKFVVLLSLHYPGKDARLQSLVIWLLCLGLRRYNILSHSGEVRDALLTFLRPFVSTAATRVSPLTSPPRFAFHPASGPHGQALVGKEIACSRARSLPPPTDPAIILTFALKEAVPLEIPYHLPTTRAIATAENRSGPTADDYTAFQRARTILLSDIREVQCRPSVIPLNKPDPWISDVLDARGLTLSRTRGRYSPGTLTGIWEGALMISSCVVVPGDTDAPATAPPDYLCRTPMQCEFSEYFCCSPCTPLPSAGHTRTVLSSCDVPRDPECFANLAYRKFALGEDFQHGPVLDHVLTGQTLSDHEEAWSPGGFNFAGRVHGDGLIVFTRQPKNDESEMAETWVFEGHLCYGTALVGTFRSSLSDELCSVHGIFSMRKRPISNVCVGRDPASATQIESAIWVALMGVNDTAPPTPTLTEGLRAIRARSSQYSGLHPHPVSELHGGTDGSSPNEADHSLLPIREATRGFRVTSDMIRTSVYAVVGGERTIYT
ncbi:hypothetical protein B0H17DRAFT_1256849 [Mycena rosella]|uniref:F-box domain-containing protein n=1 Tax=Mycena rosella TaxID=1033263 RepID=A0AAD7DUL2_MYCRO|nr:hypothetical protein B0H17DRAFT_1256849 [Mycena rosella]